MIEMTIDAKNVDVLRRFNWRKGAQRWAFEVKPVLVAAVKAKAPVSKKPGGGKLRDSIKGRYRTSLTHVLLEVGSDLPYAEMVIEGSVPHIIQPVRASALHWIDGATGNDVYSLLVRHPGHRPNPFATKALMATTPYMRRRYREIMQEQFRE